MGRIPRALLVVELGVNHCTWRAHNHERVFDAPGAREKFLELLGRHKERHGIRIYSYCLMGTHPHLVTMSTRGQEAWSRFWKVVNQGFARWYNARSGRCGQVVMDRLVSARVQSGDGGRHLLTVMRYGDRNPVRAGLVRSARHWRHSSYAHYAFGAPCALVDEPPAYRALGRDPGARRRAYRALVGEPDRRRARRRTRPGRPAGPDLVRGPFIGDARWARARLRACRLPPADSS